MLLFQRKQIAVLISFYLFEILHFADHCNFNQQKRKESPIFLFYRLSQKRTPKILVTLPPTILAEKNQHEQYKRNW